MNHYKSLCLIISLIFLITYSQQAQGQFFANHQGAKIKNSDFENFLNRQMDSLGIPGISIAVINQGKIVYSKNLGYANLDTKKKLDENSIFEAASLSKPVFAYMVMKLSERGAIDLNRPLHFYLPDASMEIDPRYKNVNTIHVLSHSTGFPNWRWFDTPPKSLKIKRGTFFMVQNPGKGFTYSGEGYDYLARVIASNTDKKMSELSHLFDQLVKQPLGIQQMYFTWDEYLYNHKVYGHINGKATNRDWGSGLPYQNSFKFNAAGALHTNAHSYAKFLIAMMHGDGLLPETYRKMLSPYTTLDTTKSNAFSAEGITHWCLGLGIAPVKNDTLYRHGGTHNDFQAQMAFSKKTKFGYVFFVNCKKGNELDVNLKAFLGIKGK